MRLFKLIQRILRYTLLSGDKKTYSSKEIIKEYCGYPTYFSLPQIQHGWYPQIEAWKRDLDGATNLFLAWNKRMRNAWVKQSKVPVVITGAPFIHYRRINKINRSSNDRGTIAFPVHSSPNLKAVYNINDYCKKLVELPEEFKPITVCLGHHDMDTIRYKYEKYGFKIVSAGDPYDKNFVIKFYNLLKVNRYSTSNRIGSYTLYSVEMGIPFFFYGDEINFHHVYRKNEKFKFIPPKNITSFANKLFKISDKDIQNANIGINKAQIDFVISESGIYECLSPHELKHVLLKTYFFKTIPRAVYRIIFSPLIISEAYGRRKILKRK